MKFVTFVRKFKGMRETGANQGARVNGCQMWSRGSTGDSWCAEIATMILDIWFDLNAPVPRAQACQDVWLICKQRSFTTTAPQPGDLFFYLDVHGHAHHMGFVMVVSPMTGAAGNTSSDGRSSNGDGFYEHELHPPAGSTLAFAHVPGITQEEQ